MYLDGGDVGGYRDAVNSSIQERRLKCKNIFRYRIKQKEHGSIDQRQIAQPTHNSVVM